MFLQTMDGWIFCNLIYLILDKTNLFKNMGNFNLKRLSDSSVDDLDKVEMLPESQTAEEVKDWVNQYIVPSLEAVSGEEISVTVDEEGDVEISGVDESAVADSIANLSKGSKNFLASIRRIIKDDEYGKELEIDPVVPEESTAKWLTEYAAPSIEEFLEEQGVAAEVTVDSETGKVTIKPENVEDVERLPELMDSYKHTALKGSLVAIKDDDDEDEDEEGDVTPEEWAEEVAAPAIEEHLEEIGVDGDVKVTSDEGDDVVITVEVESPEKKEDDDDEIQDEDPDVDEISDSISAILDNKSTGKVKVVVRRVSDSASCKVILPARNK
jgi:hypothetical protein